MPLRAVTGVIVACIAAKTSAFVSFSTRTAGIVAGHNKSRNVHSTSPLRLMMGRRGHGQNKQRTRPRVVEEEKAGGIDSSGSAPEEEEDETVPRLVVMDLDYTLW